MTLKTPEQIADAAWQSKIGNARGPWAESVIDTTVAAIEADRAQRDIAEAWREGHQAGYENGYDGLYGRADNPYK